ncbi:MAG: metal ABC transporter ATP-binding protein [Leptonema sp. (in: bacteria)]
MKKTLQECYIELENVQIGFKKIVLLENINLKIYKEDKILLLGSNGAGKTTFFKVLLGLTDIQKGEIKTYFHSISYVPQTLEVSKEFLLTIEEVLELYSDLKIFSKNQQEKAKSIYEVLKKTNLFDKRNQLLRECSGGELQRTYIARALLRKPNVLILDEPLSAVDSENQKQFFSFLEEIHKEYQCTILMSSHILVDSIMNFFNRKLSIKDKRIIEL